MADEEIDAALIEELKRAIEELRNFLARRLEFIAELDRLSNANRTTRSFFEQRQVLEPIEDLCEEELKF